MSRYLPVFLYLLLFVFFNGCGNPESEFFDPQAEQSEPLKMNYFTKTLLLYKYPFQAESFYYFLDLAEKNGTDISYFTPLNVQDKNFKTSLKKILKKNNSINIIALNLSPNSIPQWKKINRHFKKALFLFPDKPLNKDKKIKNIHLHIFPENYTYDDQFPQILKKIQLTSFNAYVLKFLTGTYITQNFSSRSSQPYLQGKTTPNTDIFLNQEKITRSNNLGLFSLITKTTDKPIQISTENSTYSILGLNSSFLFLNLEQINPHTLNIKSFFTPINMHYIQFSKEGTTHLYQKNLVYFIHMNIIPHGNKIESTYNNYSLTITIPKKFLPVEYNSHKKTKTILEEKNTLYIFNSLKNKK